jgi:hypothetical protein
VPFHGAGDGRRVFAHGANDLDGPPENGPAGNGGFVGLYQHPNRRRCLLDRGNDLGWVLIPPDKQTAQRPPQSLNDQQRKMSAPKKHKGAVTELQASAWLIANGYEVFRNVSQHGPIDLVAIKEGEPIYLDAKTTPSGRRSATDDQQRLGVKFITPAENGDFVIVDPPPRREEALCGQCGRRFKPCDRRKYCGIQCSIKAARAH